MKLGKYSTDNGKEISLYVWSKKWVSSTVVDFVCQSRVIWTRLINPIPTRRSSLLILSTNQAPAAEGTADQLQTERWNKTWNIVRKEVDTAKDQLVFRLLLSTLSDNTQKCGTATTWKTAAADERGFSERKQRRHDIAAEGKYSFRWKAVSSNDEKSVPLKTLNCKALIFN